MRKCVDSLLLGGSRVEIIIIDDGSTDKTGQIADEYAVLYPDVVKTIHQANGGHGEGINQGLRNASGKYFFVVDSDDWLNEIEFFLDKLEQADSTQEIDMVIANFTYRHDKKSLDKTVNFRNIFPKERICGWSDTKKFKAHQCLTIHTSIFRTQILRDIKMELPKHMFYEDNLLVYKTLPYCDKLLYIDMNFYQYYIGREGQSVQEKVLMRRYAQQIRASTMLFTSHNLNQIAEKKPKLAKYMYHESEMLLVIASIFARLNRSDETEKAVDKMWCEVMAFDEFNGRKLRYKSLAKYVNLQGKFGREVSIFLYRMSHRLIKFN